MKKVKVILLGLCLSTTLSYAQFTPAVNTELKKLKSIAHSDSLIQKQTLSSSNVSIGTSCENVDDNTVRIGDQADISINTNSAFKVGLQSAFYTTSGARSIADIIGFTGGQGVTAWQSDIYNNITTTNTNTNNTYGQVVQLVQLNRGLVPLSFSNATLSGLVTDIQTWSTANPNSPIQHFTYTTNLTLTGFTAIILHN